MGEGAPRTRHSPGSEYWSVEKYWSLHKSRSFKNATPHYISRYIFEFPNLLILEVVFFPPAFDANDLKYIGMSCSLIAFFPVLETCFFLPQVNLSTWRQRRRQSQRCTHCTVLEPLTSGRDTWALFPPRKMIFSQGFSPLISSPALTSYFQPLFFKLFCGVSDFVFFPHWKKFILSGCRFPQINFPSFTAKWEKTTVGF